MLLHTVNKSPLERNALESCLQHAKPGSAVLLFEDAVYGALRGTKVETLISTALQHCKLYVLGADLSARGMPADKVIPGIEIIDYAGFVDLTVEHSAVQAWL